MVQTQDSAAVGSMVRRVLPLGIPLAVGFIAQLAISFVDAALVARLGARELAGVTLGLSLFSLVMLFGLGVVTAVTPRVAVAHQAGEPVALRGWYTQGNWLALGVGLLGVCVLLNTRHLLELIGQNPHLASVAQEYNCAAAPGLPLFLLYVNARCLLTGVGKPKPATWAMLVAVPVDLVLGYALIFGAGALPRLGVAGAGMAGAAVRLLVLVLVTAQIRYGRGFRQLRLRAEPAGPRLVAQRELLGAGAWIGVRIVLGEAFVPVLAFFVAPYGVAATAAHTVGLRLESLITVFALGLSSAATTVAAWAREDSNWRALSDLRSALLRIGTVYAVGLSALVAVGYGFVVQTLFGVKDPESVVAAHQLLPYVVAFILVDTLVTLPMGYLVGLSDTRVPALVVAAGYWVLGLGLGTTLARFTGLGFRGLWLGVILGAAAVALFCFARLARHITAIRDTATEAAP
ncbi:MATE family efflux transporter [Streptomyces sp. NPDC059740]|uniref:MATE family efflux transporter n=1 Tax=Streptomyces sp. NPDC059740 TaxID=3346926 RepID=UPI00364C4BF8